MEMEIVKSAIPLQLQNESFGFVKLHRYSKIPYELDWPNKPYSYKEIEPCARNNYNYGILGGYGNLIIIDADSKEIADLVKNNLPNTFTVKSPHKGYHFYYICKDIKNKVVLKKDGTSFGDIISSGAQAVGPGSLHPITSTKYEVINDVAIANISREEVYSALVEYITIDFPKKDLETDLGDISILEVLNKKDIKMSRVGNQLTASHPVHGSTNNNNFVVNPEKNVWHCFRCNSGGGAVSLIAVLEGAIACHEAIPGAIRGDKFNQVLYLARDKYGLSIKVKIPDKNSIPLSEDKITSFEARIKAIPADTSPVKIPALLDPILKEMAGLNLMQSDALLKHTIKERFSFTHEDIKSYEDVLRGYRRNSKDNDIPKPLNQAELMRILHEEEKNKIIHPAQDYKEGIMSFSVNVKTNTCLVTSDRRLFTFTNALCEGFYIKHHGVDVARFSAKGVSSYLEGKYALSITVLYEKIYAYIKRFICFPDNSYLNYICLWIMGTYMFMVFRYYPYVWLNAEKGSGKTLLMEILSSIAFNGELITNPTESVIFRDISNNLITMFVDEVEQLRKRDKDTYGSLISLLNAGFSKSGVVKRTESGPGGSFIVKSYSAYSPKMFAGIGEIDDVLQDRTVRIPLLRKKDNETVQRYKETSEIIELQRSIRDDLYIFALTCAKVVAESYQKESITGIEGLSHLNNRELDIWEPIFLLANLVDSQSNSNNLTSLMAALSKKSIEEKQQDNITQNETYKILNLLKAMPDEVIPIKEDGDIRVYEAERVFDYFKKSDDFDWIEKTNVLTRRLKKVKIVSEQRRIEGEKKRVYIMNLKDLIDLCERFKIEGNIV